MNNLNLNVILKTELNERMASNQSYSLRAFAKALQLDPSNLSKILSGQRKLGDKAKSKILRKLGLDQHEANDYYSQLNDDVFEQAPEWYDTAILEQLAVTGFRATKKTLALVFNLNEIQVAAALIRLQKAKLVKVSRSGIVSDSTSGQTSTLQPRSTSPSKRSLQKKFLEKAMASLDMDPLEERDMTTITCATDSERITEAKIRIKKFRRELAEFLMSGTKSNRIYNISIALYPLSKNYKEFK